MRRRRRRWRSLNDDLKIEGWMMRRLAYLEVSGETYEAAIEVLNANIHLYVEREVDVVSITPKPEEQDGTVCLFVVYWAS